ncbi:hypothetical protein [Smaragdicoccus niigatensis]|uniref:hypothetical protein n=1 Tax=Smaragdicoccus niigatensis TaxID=359359 RepID=UPI0003A76805|nr:hypothetical protein [Smaragdicoccus niigatensis]
MNSPDREKQVCRACMYGLGFLVAATALCIVCVVWVANDPNTCALTTTPGCSRIGWATLVFAPFAILLLGSAGAAIQTFRSYRNGDEYQQWHIVMWLLLVCMVTYVGFSGSAWAGAGIN